MDSNERLLRDLIALSSVNPAFVPEGGDRSGEKQMGEYLCSLAAKAGLDVELQEIAPGRYNYLAFFRPRQRAKYRVVLAPHLDTVPATEEQLKPRREGDRLYGRGACDTKGSVVSMFLAVCDLACSPKRPPALEVVFAGLADEEYGQLGSRGYVSQSPKADLAIVGEPTRLKVITAHKGNLWLRLETSGKAAHGATPELGENAIHKAARLVHWLETDYRQTLQQRRHPLLGCPSVNVGVMQGGTQPNIVPPACTIRVDRRTLPGETEAGVIRELKSLMREAGVQARLASEKVAPCLPLETDASTPLVKQFLTSTGSPAQGAHYFCDAAIFSAGGTPSVVFGPGDIAQAHTVDEWISLRSVAAARRQLSRFFESLQ